MANNPAETRDLDVFLTSVESRLRAPFSSLELSRAISTASSPKEYLETIGKVLPRMDTVVQLRLLVALLGVERSGDTEVAMYELLTQAQDKTLFEDWTRVAAGLLQGILFSNDDGARDVGTEATQVLIKACGGQVAQEFDDKKLKGILDQKLPAASSASKEVIDMNPLFAPYFYSLVSPDTLERILPECMSNPHFTVNEKADILSEDERREREEQTAAVPASTKRVVEEAAPAAALPPVIMPGRKQASAKPTKKAPPAPKSSMFLPSRKPTAMVGGRMRGQAVVSMNNVKREGIGCLMLTCLAHFLRLHFFSRMRKSRD